MGRWLRSLFAGEFGQWFEVFAGALFVGGGFVGDGPHHYTGVVLVPGHQLADGLRVCLTGVVIDSLWHKRRRGVFVGETTANGKC